MLDTRKTSYLMFYVATRGRATTHGRIDVKMTDDWTVDDFAKLEKMVCDHLGFEHLVATGLVKTGKQDD